MKNVVLARIDERLIHGQVMTRLVRTTHFDVIEIVDDKIAADGWMKQITEMAVPKEFKGYVHSIDQAAEYLLGEEDGMGILVLVKTPEVIEELINRGVSVKELNLGGMGAKPGRRRTKSSISISDSEIETLKRIEEKGVEVYAQIVPGDKRYKVEEL